MAVPARGIPGVRQMTNFDRWGGRKQFNGYLYSFLVTFLALVLQAEFGAAATALAVGLGVTSGAVAWEDTHRGGD